MLSKVLCTEFICIDRSATSAVASLPNSSDIGTPIDNNWNYTNCAPQPKGLGPRPEKDTPRAFRNFEPLHEASNSSRIPQGYELVAQDIDGSVESDHGFLCTHSLKQYDPDECARICDDLPTCAAFNLYFEREPSYEPNAAAGCPNPPSTTSID